MAGVKKLIKHVSDEVYRKIEDHASEGGLYARGTAMEGYNGGYFQALQDVLLAMNGAVPNSPEWRRAFAKRKPSTKGTKHANS